MSHEVQLKACQANQAYALDSSQLTKCVKSQCFVDEMLINMLAVILFDTIKKRLFIPIRFRRCIWTHHLKFHFIDTIEFAFGSLVAIPGPTMFLSLDLLSEYWIQHGANGPLYVKYSYSTWIFCRGFSGFATDCPCGVWCPGLATCLLHVGPSFGNRILNNSWAVG